MNRLMATLGGAAGPVSLDEHVFCVADAIIGTVAYGGVCGAVFEGKYERL